MSENEFARSVRTLAQIGEFGLIEQVARPARQGPSVLLGPGDDAAVVAAPDRRVVASMDLLVEGRHFRRDWSSGYQIGRKAAAQNLADIAAMGARPTALLVGLSAPGEVEVDWAAELAAGLADESALVGASVAGGDTTRGERIVIAVTALGNLDGRAPVLRSGAHPGDAVAVAGELGWSAAGLELLARAQADPTPEDPHGETDVRPGTFEGEDMFDSLPARGESGEVAQGGESAPNSVSGPDSGGGARENAETIDAIAAAADPRTAVHRSSVSATDADIDSDSNAGSDADSRANSAADTDADISAAPSNQSDHLEPWKAKALARHRSPEPPYSAGPAAAEAGATAMLDVSDGLLADLGHIARESWVTIDLDPELFPIPTELRDLAKDCGVDPAHWFLTGGEDHALAGCFPADLPLPPGWHRIGRVTVPGGHDECRVTVSGSPWPGRQGWDHFAAES